VAEQRVHRFLCAGDRFAEGDILAARRGIEQPPRTAFERNVANAADDRRRLVQRDSPGLVEERARRLVRQLTLDQGAMLCVDAEVRLVDDVDPGVQVGERVVFIGAHDGQVSLLDRSTQAGRARPAVREHRENIRDHER
jgi:hypothetical protein